MIVTLDEAKNYIGVPLDDTSQDVALQELIDRLTDVVQRQLDWYFGEPRPVTETLSGNGAARMFLRQPPVIGDEYPIVVSDRSGVGSSEWETVDADDYEVAGRKIMTGSTWVRGARNYRFTYYEGFLTPPGDVKQLLLDLIQDHTVVGGGGYLASERIGDYAYTAVTAETVQSSGRWAAVYESYRRGRI